MPESARSIAVPARSWASLLFGSGWLWGLAATVLFYAAIPYIPDSQGTVKRYFTAHWIEYTTTGLFLVGMASLLVRAASLPAEKRALSNNTLGRMRPAEGESATTCAGRILDHFDLVAPHDWPTVLGRRIVDVCHYVQGRRSTEGLESQLSYLADSAAVRLNGSYAFIRTITWAIPILGFLGTVIGITMSIANITPDQLESSLGEVTGGLAVAFDTTALSLALSMVLVFSTFLIERQEQQILDAVEDCTMQSLVAIFPSPSAGDRPSPLLEAEEAAARQVLAKTETLVAWQMDAWKVSLEGVRERWLTTLEKQQAALDQALESGFREALSDHAQQLASARSDFVTAFGQAAESIQQHLTVTQDLLHTQHTDNLQHLEDAWQRIRGEFSTSADRQAAAWEAFSEQLKHSVHGWQEQLKDASVVMTGQLAELRQQGGILLRISEQEEQLVRLEDRLAQNLETVRVVDTLDETLLSLNAAVNLLSAKTRNKAA